MSTVNRLLATDKKLSEAYTELMFKLDVKGVAKHLAAIKALDEAVKNMTNVILEQDPALEHLVDDLVLSAVAASQRA